MFHRNKENKAKLEHKLYLARENPEPTFDLSECGIKNVPQGIYSLCKVFLKDVLNLSHNYLTSLSGGGNLKDLSNIKILNLGNNLFTNIPEEICFLSNLVELYVNNNELKKLPYGICELRKLEKLDISGNKLHSLPENIGKLCNLRKLNLLENKKLSTLPKSISQAQKLIEIKLDVQNFTYPPAHIAQCGCKEILTFICNDVGTDYNPIDNSPPAEEADSSDDNVEYSNLQEKMWTLEKIKAQKVKEFIEIEKSKELQQRQEFELANASKVNKDKFLQYLTEQQNQFDKDLLRIQRDKDFERFQLVEQLQEVERRADDVIKQLLLINNEPLLNLLEYEKDEEAKLIEAANKYNEEIRKTDILEAMQKLIEEETIQFNEFEKYRSETTNSILEKESQANSHVLDVLIDQINAKSELITKLQDDEQLQRAAVGALLERSDARSWGLIQQVRLVEAKLAELTAIELDKRRLDLDECVIEIDKKRINLSLILIDLLQKQDLRRAELISTLKSLDESNVSPEDFWLRQYQHLLNRIPSSMMKSQRNMDQGLTESLLMHGVVHCIPFLAKWCSDEVHLLNDDDLVTVGISSAKDRERILEAIHSYGKLAVQEENKSSEKLEEASAPPEPLDVAHTTSECVICMDKSCQIIFVPCGHLCCCANCSLTIDDCPLCRGTISRKIRVISA